MSLVAVGDNVVDCYVDLGVMFPGGNSVNVAVHAARAGTPTAYVGAVGTDERGELVSGALAAEGIDTSRLRILPGPSAYAVVRHVAGDRVFGRSDKGVSLFRPDDADLRFVAGFGLAHSSYCSGLEGALPDLAAAVPLSFDFDDRTGSYAEELLPHVRVATFSASHLSRRECEELVRWAADLGPSHVFATRGAEGVVSFADNAVHAATAPTEEVTDSLGAGDAFIGRALHGLLTGEPVPMLLEAAVAAGGRACATLGGFGHGRPLSGRVEEPVDR
jgi:fructoselysine 6-kinase